MKIIRFSKLLILAGLLVIVTSCKSDKEKADQAKQSIKVEKVMPVSTMIAKEQVVDRNISYTASLIPFNEIYLAPATPGKISKINVEVGDHVKKGKVVVSMDRTNLESAHINILNLKTNFERLEELKKTNTVAEQKYDETKAAYESAKVSYQFLLDNTELKAPFSGIVSGKYYEDGENFSGAPNTRAGKSAIVTIVQINKLKALVGISSIYFPQIKKGMKAKITCDIYPNETFTGEIYNIYPTIDNTTKTFTVEIKINNSNLKLRPGMFSKIELNLGEGHGILVPTIALVKQTGTNDMYLFLNKNNVAVKQHVLTGRLFDDKTEIISGIEAGDEIIIAGQNKIQNKTKLIIKNNTK